MAEELTPTAWQQLAQRLGQLPVPARRLLCVIVRQAYYGTLRSKAPGHATMPEVHEACGLDVDELQRLLALLKDAHLICVEDAYPFEEVMLQEGGTSIWEMMLRHCDSTGTPLETIVVDLQLP